MTSSSQNLITAVFQPQPGFYDSFPVNNNANTHIAMTSENTYFNTIPGTFTNQPNGNPFKLNITTAPDNYTFTISCSISAFQNTLNNSTLQANSVKVPEGFFIMYLTSYSSNFSPTNLPSPSNANIIQIGLWESYGNSSLIEVFSNQIIYNNASQTFYASGSNSVSYLQNVFGSNTFYVGLYFEPKTPTVYAVGNTQTNYTNPSVTLTNFNNLQSSFPPQKSQLVNIAFYSLNTATNSVEIPQVLSNALSMSSYLNKTLPNSPVYFSAIQNQIQNVLTIYNISELDVENIQLPIPPTGYFWSVTNVIMFFILSYNTYSNNSGYAVIPTYFDNNTGLNLYDELHNYFLQLIYMNQQSINSGSFKPFDITATIPPGYNSTIGYQIDTILTQPYTNTTNKQSLSASYLTNKFFNIGLQLIKI